MAFLALQKMPEAFIQGHVHWTEKNLAVWSKPEWTVENSFFENETIFVFITPRSWANLALKKNFHNARSLQENNARSPANQSVPTIVAL